YIPLSQPFSPCLAFAREIVNTFLRAANKTSDLALRRLASAVKLIVVSRSEEEVHDLATGHESFLRRLQSKGITGRQNQAVGIRPG
ncbi:hypothetical protein, partial [Chromobacterium sp. LK11]|uniref:hypothetical protein n=1 Tax=Chromobacterium sp. LK11 TaxID=1628212 RepID=UPI001E2944E3